MVHYYYPRSGQALCHFFVRGSHFLPSQLPGKHTGHKAASRYSEPIWNAHYSSTHHHCQGPILHLGEGRHTWSSHLAQGCYIAANWQHWDSNLQCVDSESNALSTQPSHLHYARYLVLQWQKCMLHPEYIPGPRLLIKLYKNTSKAYWFGNSHNLYWSNCSYMSSNHCLVHKTAFQQRNWKARYCNQNNTDFETCNDSGPGSSMRQ